jgi:thioredoxin 1
MKKIITLSIAFVVLASFTKSEEMSMKNMLDNTTINFETNLEIAKAKAKAENKSIFVFAYAAWSGPCKRMISTTFANEGVVNYLNANYINVLMECENQEGKLSVEGQAFVTTYGIKNYPVVIVMDANGKMSKSSLSAKDDVQLLDFLKM